MDFVLPVPLCDWLKRTPKMLEWDAIIALPVEQVTYALHQQILSRRGDLVGDMAVGGRVVLEGMGHEFVYEGYRLSATGMSVESPSLERAEARLHLALEGGGLLEVSDIYDIVRVESHSPTNSLSGHVDVNIAWHGNVLYLDVRNGKNHYLDLGMGDFQDLSGAHLKEALDALAESSALIPLATIADVHETYGSFASAKVGSQVDVAEAARGAIVCFISMQYGGNAHVPVGYKDLPFMLPSSAEQPWLCSAALSWHCLHRLGFGQAIASVFPGATYHHEEQERLLVATTIEGGALAVAGGTQEVGCFELVYEAFNLPLAQAAPLTISFRSDQVEQAWQCRCEIGYQYRPWRSAPWIKERKTFDINLNYLFDLSDPEGLASLSGRLRRIESEGALLHWAASAATVHARVQAIIEYVAVRAYINALCKRLTAKVAEQVLACMRLPGSLTLKSQYAELHNNLAVLGEFQGDQGALRLVPQGATVAAGGTIGFSVGSQAKPVNWSLLPLPGYSDVLGAISDSGEYRAPEPEALKGRLQRLKVVASTADVSAEALITVDYRAICISPQFKLCLPPLAKEAPQHYELTATVLQEGAGTIVWSIENERVGSGTIAGIANRAIYTPAPTSNKSFFVEQIRAAIGSHAVTVLALVEYARPALQLYPDETVAADGRLGIKAYQGTNPRDTAIFSIPKVGTGSLETDSEGVWYKPDPANPDASVLITASYTNSSNVVSEGYVVIPLPLDRFTELRKAQAIKGRSRRQQPEDAGR